MNPAVLNYLQSQQGQQSAQDEQPQGQQSYNPFDSGIRAAIESARVSLDMTEKQQDKALRRSMLGFANAYGNEPKRKDFIGNFGAVARSLSPAILAHDESEDLAFKENNDLANQILRYQAAEQAKQSQEEERNWHRQHAENQLAEQRRYHDMMDSYHNKQLGQNNTFGVSNLNGMELVPIDNKKDFNGYLKDKKSIGTVLNDINKIQEDYQTFKNKTAKNIFDPMGQGRYFTNKAKDFTGRFLNNKALKDETADRETLNSELNKFVTSSERALKGGGVIGPRLIELFKQQGIYPDLQEDPRESFESKLKNLKDEIEHYYKAANLSLKYKVHIDPSQVTNFENNLKGHEVPSENLNTDNGYKTYIGQKGYEVVQMKDENGQIREVPPNRVEAAVKERKWNIVPSDEVIIDE